MEPKISFQVGAETLKSRYNQLKEVIDELESLGVLVNENLRKFRQDIQDVFYFYRADYKFSFMIQGEMNAGKSTCLNALLGQRILAVSSVPETNFITCVVHDRENEIPLLYKTTLSKIYNSQTSNFHISDEDLEFAGVSGTENIYNHLNGSNQDARKKVKQMEEQLEKKEDGKEAEREKFKEELYKDVKLDDTVYVIKCRIKSLEEKIKDEFILKRIQLIDFPGMFEYGQNKITEIYKIFEDNTQGLINILHPLGYEGNVKTKLQNSEKYPNRLLIMVNKMDQIAHKEEDAEEEGDDDEDDVEKKAAKLVKNLQNSLQEIGNRSSDEQQKEKYLKMSKEVPSIVHFVTGKEEMMNLYLTKHKNSTQQHEKDLYDSILVSFAEDDQAYKPYLKKAKNQNKPFAEIGCFDFFEEGKSNLFDKIKESMTDKFKCRFNELITKDYPNKVNSIRNDLVDFIEKLIREGSAEKNPEDVHIFFKCDGCGADPIVGVRYHCKVCNDFDFCAKCKATREHPQHEFQTLEKFSFMDYTKEYCYTHFLGVIKPFLEFKEKFISQLKDLFINLIDGFALKKGPNYFKEILTSHCSLFNKNKEEIEKQFKLEEEILPIALIAVFAKWEKHHGAVIRLILIETLSLIGEVIQTTKKSLVLAFAISANVLKSVITAVLGQGDSASLANQVYENVDLTALLLTNVFDSEKRINNVAELTTQTIVWSEGFKRVYGKIAVDSLQLSLSIAEKVERAMNLGGVLEIVFQDEGKVKDLNEKLEKVLEKVKNIEFI